MEMSKENLEDFFIVTDYEASDNWLQETAGMGSCTYSCRHAENTSAEE